MAPPPWYYARLWLFGVSLGIRHLLRHGFVLGWRRSLGKLMQPVNAISRYPEYWLFEQAMQPVLQSRSVAKLLDVGSPKLFPLYVGARHRVDGCLSDINGDNYQDYRLMSHVLPTSASISFADMDGRALPFGADSFDLVVSMSVIEHIEGRGGDGEALSEMWRVLRPGGRLVVSVPFGSMFVSQQRRDFSYFKTERTNSVVFFQRIYDEAALSARVLSSIATPPDRVSYIHRRRPGVLYRYLRLGLNARGAIGFLSPLLARWVMRIADRFDADAAAVQRYTDISEVDDVYSDAIMVWTKPIA